MTKHKKWDRNTLTLAFCIALLPPLWAVLAPHIGIQTGAVALICAGLYVTNGNKLTDGVKISAGFLLGDFWAWAAIHVMAHLPFGSDGNLFVTLFVMGGLAVLISALLPRWIHCPSWLCGWAIGLTILSPMGVGNTGTYPFQIAAAMLAGVWYVGAFLNAVQQKLAGNP